MVIRRFIRWNKSDNVEFESTQYVEINEMEQIRTYDAGECIGKRVLCYITIYLYPEYVKCIEFDNSRNILDQ